MLTAVLVGCGAMADGWLRALKDTPELVAAVRVTGLVDLKLQAAQDLATRFGLKAQVGVDLPQMLAALSPDLVFDLVVPTARANVVETALAAGAHVLSEKPMANSLAEAKALILAASHADRIHAVIQNRRYQPGIRQVKALIDSGVLGELTAVHMDFFIGAHFGGFREKMDHVLLLDMAIHSFDAARYLINAAPTAVYCRETNPKGSWYAHGASADALFDFDNDVTLTYRGSWCAEGANTSWECDWRIIGTKGTIIWDGNAEIVAQVVAEDSGFFRALQPIKVLPAPPMVADHAGVILDFVQSILNHVRPMTDGRDNIHSLAMVTAAIESAQLGVKCPIEIA